MRDIIENNGWVSVKSNTTRTFFNAVDKPFLGHTMMLEVIVGKKVLVNGSLFHQTLIPTIKEAQKFCRSLCDEV
jgi:hypothetical protein